jgi:hypothetical protein
MHSTVATLIFLIVSIIVVAFQLALMLGAPWGQLTLGGKYTGALPNHMRLVCLLTTVIFLAFVMVVLTRAGWILPHWFAVSTQLIWAVVLYCFVGVIANALTPSRYERMLWLPAVIVLFASSFSVATA